MTADDNDGWDEWEDDTFSSPPLSPTGSGQWDRIEKTQAYPMMNLPPITPHFSDPDDAQSNEEKLLLLHDDVPKALQISRERMQALQALALVTRVHVLALFASDEFGNKSRMPTLSDAEILQDAKDIGRDELLVNGERVGGAKGYDAVVDALQRELELVLARQAGMTPEQTPMAVSNALQSVAMAVVHASNRTESGGCSYELLSKFLSKHEMTRVLLRPDSARAAPLEVYLDLGPYLEAIPGSDEPTWAFGLRVKLVAVTWYLVCDTEDPTTELYEIETTFCNRLAFPVGLTPFLPLDTMRKDRGNVTVRLVRPCTPECTSPRRQE
ncbi:unnamed protein product [Peronospora destructor]|uniref:Uncharacterized protein n=1 Tax=Peronospora destructor TaxID=86335 RepID=A0AAV0U8M9_9STRA|nr:unnamed protein product [Peronospora destructor]